MGFGKATATAHPNIAFIKYWGNHNASLRMPLNDSLSMNLAALSTETTVGFEEGLETDEILIGGEPADERTAQRVRVHLDLIRGMADLKLCARVHSRNNFPAAAGLASSASAFAALSVAASKAAGLELNERALTILARRGSGSAARSIPAGFVEWLAATSAVSTSEQSYARSIMSPDAWDLHDVIAIVSTTAKSVSSSDGHRVAHTSPFMSERLSRLPIRYHRVRRELLKKDLEGMGPDIEAEAIELHVIAMTSRPPIFYWLPGTVRVMDAVREWRKEGLRVYYTLDAGPNVHLLCEAKDSEQVAKNVAGIAEVQQVIVSSAGGGAQLCETHLF